MAWISSYYKVEAGMLYGLYRLWLTEAQVSRLAGRR